MPVTHLVRLHAHRRPLRRGSHEVQFGLSQDSGLALSGLTPDEADLLCTLDRPQSLAALTDAACARGVSRTRLSELLVVLDHHQVLVQETETATSPAGSGPAGAPHSWALRAAATASAYRLAGDGSAVVASRAQRVVQVVGAGQLGRLVAGHLRDSGVGQVLHTTWAEIGLSGDGRRPDLGVLLATGALPAEAVRAWRDAGLAHLPVLVRERSVSVGPLVLPGNGPCLHCLDLHRRDRDLAWPGVMAQLSDGTLRADADPVLAAAGAAVTAMLAQARIDGLPVPTGICWEVQLPWPEVLARVWLTHPSCACHRPAA